MPHSLSALSIALFGISSFIFGLHNLLQPATGLSTLNLPHDALPAYYSNGLAAVAMGVYYTLAAYQRNWTFFVLTVPMRSLTAVVFWNLGGMWKTAGVWEGGGAMVTGLCLLMGL